MKLMWWAPLAAWLVASGAVNLAVGDVTERAEPFAAVQDPVPTAQGAKVTFEKTGAGAAKVSVRARLL
ncbi:MAG: hypothetical protein RL398_2453, partial [Planctomycetota bacterium]